VNSMFPLKQQPALLCLAVLQPLLAQNFESLYEFFDIPNCSQLGVWNHEVPVLAGSLGFYGTFGHGVPGTLSRFRLPRAVALDEMQQRLYISDAANHAVRLLSLSDNNLTTVMGSLGVPGFVDGTSALLREPNGLALDFGRQELYVADQGNHAIRVVDLSSQSITTLVGDGNSSNSSLKYPAGLALLESERILYISDAGNNQIRRLDLETGDVSSPAPEAFFQSPAGLAYNDLNKFLYVSDSATHAVYRLNLTEDSPMPVVVAGRPHHPGGPGDGSTFISPSVEGKLNRPDGLALDVIGQRLFIGDSTKAIRVVDLISETMTLAAVRSSFQHPSGHLGPIGIALGNTTVPGFIVESIWHNPLIGGPPQFGNYFYFQSSKGYASPKTASGILRSRHYRNGILLWVGYIQFFGERYGIGPERQSSPELDNAGIRYPPPVSAQGQFEIGDIILVPELLDPDEEARQMLYMAEGHSYTVRSVDLGAPANSSCGDPAVTGLPDSLWALVPAEAGGGYTTTPSIR